MTVRQTLVELGQEKDWLTWPQAVKRLGRRFVDEALKTGEVLTKEGPKGKLINYTQLFALHDTKYPIIEKEFEVHEESKPIKKGRHKRKPSKMSIQVNV